MTRARVALLPLVLLAFGCMEETGSGLVEFQAFAGGQERPDASEVYAFETTSGYHVVLERANLVIGAVYLNRAKPILGAQDTACVLTGLYTGEVRSKASIDALSPELQAFAGLGHGSLERALTAEVWLTGGDIDAPIDGTKILDFAGSATRDGMTYSFFGSTTISQNRAVAASDPATPGANPLCKQRIVTPIPVDVEPSEGGRLVVRVMPRVWFDLVDFAKIKGVVGNGEAVEIPDLGDDSVSNALLQGLRSVDSYRIDWQP